MNVENRVSEWITSSFITEDERSELKQKLAERNEDLEDAFYKDIEFGTGGIRSILGLGTNRINAYTIRRATLAFANALKKSFSGDISVAIGFDSRNYSIEFSREAASVLAAQGIKVHLFDHLTPTPVLSYAVRYFKAQGGIMITASHNPRIYNGYKAYWDDGCQVTPPNDVKIIDEYNSITDFSSIPIIEFDQGQKEGLIQYINEECENSYYKIIESLCLKSELCKEKGKDLNIVFTPLHGTGGSSVPRALENIGFTNVQMVPEQSEPDGDFPTVSPPNPEEPEALELAIKLLKETNADLAMATDPDTDRLGVVINHQGQEVLLTGNQIGALFLNYICENKELGKNPLFVKTIVTTPLQEVIAENFGVKVENTLTGFKWICGRLKQLEDEGAKFDFVFATEESYGYLSHTDVRDKDAVNACALMAEIALFYKDQGKNLVEALDLIYEKFGFSHEQLLAKHYLGKSGAERIARIVEYFRNHQENLGSEFCGFKILEVEDYQAQTIINLETKESRTLTLPKSNVIGLILENNNKVYLRPSGTEPKIKFYIMTNSTEGDLEQRKTLARTKASEIQNYLDQKCEEIK